MTQSPGSVSHGARLKIVADLFAPRPGVYWLDFGLSVGLGWAAFVIALRAGMFSVVWVPATVICVLALYRAVLFTHELAHLKRGAVPGFRVFWDLFCGFPLMVPSFLYHGVHNEHHFRDNYGTSGDGEYLSFGVPPRAKIVWYLLSHLVLPPLLVVRFAVLGPLSWVIPPLRHWLWRRVSSLSIDYTYARQVPAVVPRSWVIQETLCSMYLWCALIALYLGALPASLVAQWYLVSLLVLTLNALRTLAAHRYAHSGGRVSFDDQLTDSVNLTSGLLTPLLAPVGLRYHATHHLFPTIPYHNLGRAHRRLCEQLPGNDPYRLTESAGFLEAFRALWRNAAGIERPAVRSV